MLTIIGIAVVILGLLGWYASHAIVITKTATVTVIGDISNERPLTILYPGWAFIAWPFQRVKQRISTAIRTDNVPKLTVTCMVDDPVNAGQSHYRKDALGKLETREISQAWQIHFWLNSELTPEWRTFLRSKRIRVSMSAQLTKCFELVQFKADGSMDITALQERVKDIVHTALAEESQNLQLYAGINFTTPATETTPAINHMKRVEETLRREILALNLPVRIISLERNAPFEALGEAGKAIDRRTATAIEMEAKVLEEQTALRVAMIAVDTEKAVGDKLIVRLQKLAEAYGLSKLPPAAQLQAKLDLEAMDVYRAMAKGGNSNMVIMPDMLGKIGAALTSFGKGGTP